MPRIGSAIAHETGFSGLLADRSGKVLLECGHCCTSPLLACVDDGWRGEARVIEDKYGSGILATKSILDTTGDVWAIPAPLVTLLLR